ncbi:MAG: GTP-binding protein [Bacteroidota bacterium]
MTDPEKPLIPVTIVTGFLGAGKTTLINRLITSPDARGLKLGLIVNDFGSINLDASEMHPTGSTVFTLEGGCVCCSLSGGLVRAISALSSSSLRPEHILVEASGVSDPLGIVMPLVSGGLHTVVRLTAVVTVVDVGQVGHWPSEAAETLAETQVRSASAVVLSKTAQHDALARQAAEDWVARLAPAARRLEGDELAPALLLDTDRDVLAGLLDPAARDRAEARHLDAFDTWMFETEAPFASLARLRRTLSDLPREVIRAKGLVQVADSTRPIRFHLVGGTVTTRFVDTWPPAWPTLQRSRVAMLGAANTLDKQALHTHVEAALAEHS